MTSALLPYFCFGDSPGVGGVECLRLDVISLAPEAFAPLQGFGVIMARAFALVWRNFTPHIPGTSATDRYASG